MSDLYAIFYGQVNEQSAHNLIQNLSRVSSETTHVHLMLHSTGGLSTEGFGIYKYLQTYPIELSIYNVSYVQSAAVTIYLGAKNRIVSRGASFMIHRAYAKPPMLIDQHEESIKAIVERLVSENELVSSVITKNTRFPEKDFASLGARERWFSADEAVEFGIAISLGDFSPPKGTHVKSFF